MNVSVEVLNDIFLDYFVGKAEGKKVEFWYESGEPIECVEWKFIEIVGGEEVFDYAIYNPSIDWNIAGEIINREKISTVPVYNQSNEFVFWQAKSLKWVLPYEGETAIIAAMRAYVSHKLGEIVEI